MGDILTNLLAWLEGGWFADWLGGLVSYCLDRLVDERGINLSVCLSLISLPSCREVTTESLSLLKPPDGRVLPQVTVLSHEYFFFIILAV